MIIPLPIWVQLILISAAALGLFLLIRSILKLVALYNNPNSVEFSASQSLVTFEIKQTGAYEIAVKRPYLFGVIPTTIQFRLVDTEKNVEVPVVRSLNLFSQRKNLSGERIVPVSEFVANETGNYQLQNFNPEKFKEKDKLLITPKTGAKGFLLIFAVLFSAILFLGASIITVLSFVRK